MHIITRKMRANVAAHAWRRQYFPTPGADIKGPHSQKLKELEALGENPDPDDVDRIIENTSWTDVPECSECGVKDADLVGKMEKKGK